MFALKYYKKILKFILIYFVVLTGHCIFNLNAFNHGPIVKNIF